MLTYRPADVKVPRFRRGDLVRGPGARDRRTRIWKVMSEPLLLPRWRNLCRAQDVADGRFTVIDLNEQVRA
jgi:hypothetical protein